jgi:hypothetical protein
MVFLSWQLSRIRSESNGTIGRSKHQTNYVCTIGQCIDLMLVVMVHRSLAYSLVAPSLAKPLFAHPSRGKAGSE